MREPMTDDLQALNAETAAALAAASDLRAWDAVRVATLGRNGRLTALLRDLGKTPPEQRRERGAALNQLKDALTELIEARRAALDHAQLDARLAAERLDPTLPPRPRETGLEAHEAGLHEEHEEGRDDGPHRVDRVDVGRVGRRR